MKTWRASVARWAAKASGSFESAAVSAPRSDRDTFLHVHRRAIVECLNRIHKTGDRSTCHGRFLAIALPDQHAYVQSLFLEQDTRMVCEVASGFYLAPPGEPRTHYLAPAAKAALGRLGFSTDDEHGNFQYEFALGTPPRFDWVADLMLLALHDAYGASPGTRLELAAPLLPRWSWRLRRYTLTN